MFYGAIAYGGYKLLAGIFNFIIWKLEGGTFRERKRLTREEIQEMANQLVEAAERKLASEAKENNPK